MVGPPRHCEGGRWVRVGVKVRVRVGFGLAALRRWEEQGLLVHREHIFEGIGSCVDALNGLFTGVNIGKTLVRLSGS